MFCFSHVVSYITPSIQVSKMLFIWDPNLFIIICIWNSKWLFFRNEPLAGPAGPQSCDAAESNMTIQLPQYYYRFIYNYIYIYSESERARLILICQKEHTHKVQLLLRASLNCRKCACFPARSLRCFGIWRPTNCSNRKMPAVKAGSRESNCGVCKT